MGNPVQKPSLGTLLLTQFPTKPDPAWTKYHTKPGIWGPKPKFLSKCTCASIGFLVIDKPAGVQTRNLYPDSCEKHLFTVKSPKQHPG